MDLPITRALPDFLIPLLDDLNRIIGPIHLVGGIVRDSLQHKPPSNDLDLLVSMPLESCRQRLMQAGHRSIVLGKNEKSLLLPLKTENPKTIEISNMRHRPDHPPTVEEDLLHRDITVNAMAYTWPNGPFYDPFQGFSDLLAQKIRLVNGSATLEGDPLRALRFFRFILQLNGIPDPVDLERSENTLLTQIADERLRAELDRIFSLPLQDEAAHAMIFRLFESPLGSAILPEVAALRHIQESPAQPEQAWQHTIKTMLTIAPPDEEKEEIPLLDLRWAALLHEIGKPVIYMATGQNTGIDFSDHMEETALMATQVCNRLHFSKRRQRRIHSLIIHLDFDFFSSDRAMRRLIQNKVPIEGLFHLLRAKWKASVVRTPAEEQRIAAKFHRSLNRCQVLRTAINTLGPRDLAMNGGDILELVRKPAGPWLGLLQQRLVKWVTADPSRNNREMLARQVQAWISEGMEEVRLK